ncbi:MAG TPA: hypothetical protein DDX85_11380 [Nitrospiraceae bacterium]|nr:hypothetical protein [Nitrospiraceae bacterium]
MKTVLKLLLVTGCLIPAISLSYAQEAYINKTPDEGTILDHQKIPAHNNTRFLSPEMIHWFRTSRLISIPQA